MEMRTLFYDHFADSYDAMINWESRLEREQDDLSALIAANRIKSVIDVGCGTGIHPIVFSKMGLKVVGVDNSPHMLKIARQNAKKYQATGIEFIEGEFTKLDEVVKGPFDSVVCLGNSLPHLMDDGHVLIAFQQFYNLLNPGGLLLVQTVHFEHYLDSPDSAVAVGEGVHRGMKVTFRRHYEFKGTKVIFHVSIYDQHSKDLLESYSSPLNAIRREVLEAQLGKAGFVDVQFCRDFSLTPLSDEDRSQVIAARRPLE
jgi:SAM-dependent methyltransferase